MESRGQTVINHGSITKTTENTVIFTVYPVVFVIVIVKNYVTVYFFERNQTDIRYEKSNVIGKVNHAGA